MFTTTTRRPRTCPPWWRRTSPGPCATGPHAPHHRQLLRQSDPAVRRHLAAAAGDAARADAALAALDAYLTGLPPIDPAMRELVARLRGAGRVKIGLLSNASRGWTERHRARGGTLFDDIVVSADVGMAKPDPEVFRLAARRLGVEPAACLMVDDQPQHVDGARGAGLRAHLYERARLGELIALLEAEGALG